MGGQQICFDTTEFRGQLVSQQGQEASVKSPCEARVVAGVVEMRWLASCKPQALHRRVPWVISPTRRICSVTPSVNPALLSLLQPAAGEPADGPAAEVPHLPPALETRVFGFSLLLG